MAEKSNIEWTDATWNPIGGCAILSPGCINCYAQRLAGTRLKHHPLYVGTTDLVKGKPVFNGHLTAAPDDHPVWAFPIRWRGAKNPKMGPGKPSMIFVGDMADAFHADRPRHHINRMFAAAALSRHVVQFLTKRADVLADYIAANPRDLVNAEAGTLQHWDKMREASWPAANIWLGFSAERQDEFDKRWPHMRKLAEAGWTVFLSYEPAIGPLALPDDFLALGRWVIAGGESGPGARPMHPDWARSIRDQCAAAHVPFFFKQWGEYIGGDPDGRGWFIYQDRSWSPNCDHDFGDGHGALKVGKRHAGRILDGREHREFPRGVTGMAA